MFQLQAIDLCHSHDCLPFSTFPTSAITPSDDIIDQLFTCISKSSTLLILVIFRKNIIASSKKHISSSDCSHDFQLNMVTFGQSETFS